MNQRKLSNVCTAMLAFSMVVRLLLATGWGAETTSYQPPAAEAMETEVRLWPVYLSMETVDEPVPVPLTLEQVETLPVPAPEPLAFSAQEAGAITIRGGCTYQVDKAALLTGPTAMELQGEGPKVLLVHTHTSEAYTQEAGHFYDATEAYRTPDADHSVVRVGEEIAAILREAGIETLHHTALNDHPTYDGAYERMRQTIEGYLAEYPTIQMVLDVHRDAALESDGSQVGLWAEVDGETCAQVMLVVGTDQGGLEHPNWQENLANALKLQALLNRQAPGLCRDLDLRTERFNQHLTPGSLLAEFGAAGNTLSEALAAARHFGRALATLLTT